MGNDMGQARLRIGIITGSTRPNRNNVAVARWVYEIAEKRSDAVFELVDMLDYNLPLLDEPLPPSLGQYSNRTRNAGLKRSALSMHISLSLPNTTTASRVL